MNMKKLCISWMLFFTCIICFNFSITAFAIEAGTIDNLIMWYIDEDTLTIKNVDESVTGICQNNSLFIYGSEYRRVEVSDELGNDENEPFFRFLYEHPINYIELHVAEMCDSIGNSKNLLDVKELIIGEEVEVITKNALEGMEQLNYVKVYSKDIALQDSCLGYMYDDSGKLVTNKALVIYGYNNSTADIYASQNGFTFISLDEQPTNTATTADLTTFSVTTTTVTTADSTTSSATTTTATTADLTTFSVTTTTVTTTDPITSSATTTTATTTDIITTDSTIITTTSMTTTDNQSTLPKTGYSDIYKVIVVFAVLMTVSGAAIVVKTKKETE